MEPRAIIMELMGIVNSNIPFTDIHFEENERVMIRGLNGWEPVGHLSDAPTTREDLVPLLEFIDPEWERLIKQRAINRPAPLDQWRLRVNGYMTRGGERVAVVIRRQPKKPLPLSGTGLPPSIVEIADANRGIILTAGPAGAGKSTTLAAIVHRINEARHAHIITIEDPIEYIHDRIRGIISQREVGIDVESYLTGVEDAMRQCPQAMLIGEIRDAATARAALLAAESGVLVLASVHANSAVGAVSKMISFFPEDERRSRCEALSLSLVGVIAQTLLPRSDKSGFIAAAEVLSNVNQFWSPYISDHNKLSEMWNRDEDPNSISMQKTILDMTQRGHISKRVGEEALTAFGKVALGVSIRNVAQNSTS